MKKFFPVIKEKLQKTDSPTNKAPSPYYNTSLRASNKNCTTIKLTNRKKSHLHHYIIHVHHFWHVYKLETYEHTLTKWFWRAIICPVSEHTALIIVGARGFSLWCWLTRCRVCTRWFSWLLLWLLLLLLLLPWLL